MASALRSSASLMSADFFCSASFRSPSAFLTAAIRTLPASELASETISLAFACALASCSSAAFQETVSERS
jgi:hypothetical protein